MKIHPFRVSPHLSPRRGYPRIELLPLFTCVLSEFCRMTPSPTSVGFERLARPVHGGCRARRKPPSSLTRKRVHRRTGLAGKGQGMSFTVLDGCNGFYEWARERHPLPCRTRVMPEWHTCFDGFNGFPLTRERERLESFLRLSGMACLRPFTPSGGPHPPS